MGYPDPHENVADLQDVDLEALAVRPAPGGLAGRTAGQASARVGESRPGRASSRSGEAWPGRYVGLLEGLHGEFGRATFQSKEILARIGTDRTGALSHLAEAVDNLAGDKKLTSHTVGLVPYGPVRPPHVARATCG